MTTGQYVEHLRRQGIVLQKTDDKLSCQAPKGVVNGEFLAGIRERKAELLAFLTEQDACRSGRTPRLDPEGRAGPLPVSAAQRRMIFLSQVEPGFAYKETYVLCANGPLNILALEAAVVGLVERHQILRTNFQCEDGEPRQVIHPGIRPCFRVVDWRQRAGGDDTEVVRAITEEARRLFSIRDDPLFQCTVWRLTDARSQVLLAFHHIVVDDWSLGVCYRDLAGLYKAYAAGVAPALPPLAVQYADFAAAEQDFLSSASFQEQLAYWTRTLSGQLPVLELPTDRPRPAVASFRGACRSRLISRSLVDSIKRLGAQQQSTLFMVLLAAYAVVLHRYTSQSEFLIGFLTAGRRQVALERLIGYFVNTIPLRIVADGSYSFLELLKEIRRRALESFANQVVPFERIVQSLAVPRDSSRPVLFNVLFILQNTPCARCELDGLDVTVQHIHNGSSKFDLSLFITEDAGQLDCCMDYNTDLFDASTIDRFLGHFGQVLQSAVSNPAQAISEIPMLTSEQRRTLLLDWNDTALSLPAEVCVHDLVEAQAARTPELVAVQWRDRQWSYAELNVAANQIARRLQILGVGRETLVGVCLKRDFNLVAALLGLWKAGAAYLPLDPAYPRERLLRIVQDSGARLVVTESGVADSLGAAGMIPLLLLDRERDALSTMQQCNLRSGVQPTDLAYTIYTSGSTGQPKGVEVEHRAILNVLTSMGQLLDVNETDGWLAVTSLSFDISVPEIFLPLIRGARVVMADHETCTDWSRLAAALEVPAVTIVQATPTAWRLLVDSGWTGNRRLRALCGGEPLPRELAREIRQRVRLVWNMYGPTETCVWSTAFRIDTDPIDGVPIGRPLANTIVYLLDSRMQPVPVGVAGELYIGGAGLARGYLNQPGLTAERFVKDSVSGKAGARLYRTGDLAKWRTDGNLEYLGRTDRQVKVRGFRVELGEIEATLTRQPGVAQAVAIADEDQSGEKRLVGYVVAEPGHSVDGHTLRQQLARILPNYMMPGAIVVLEALPLTPNGKVDRKALPRLADSVSCATRTKPRSALESKLVQIWEEVLDIRPLGITDDFFDLGGHSLLAIRLIAKICETFGCDVPAARLFLAPTVERFVALVDECAPGESSILIPIRKTGRRPPLFCVSRPNVDALWFGSLAKHLDTEQPVYGLQSRMKEIDGMFTQEQIEQKAAEYIEAMLQVQPEGPFLITGFCQGGLIAFEMGRQLEARGLEVGLLAMLDVWPEENTLRRWLHYAKYFWQRCGELVRMSSSERMRFARRIVRTWMSGLHPIHSTTQSGGSPVKNKMSERYWPGPDFRPPTYSGKIIAFRAPKQMFSRIRDPQMGWGSRALGGVEVIAIPGEHGEILREPNVQVLAKKLAACINRVIGGSVHNLGCL